MKKYVCFFFAVICSIFLTACSGEEDAANLYKQEQPLELNIIIPESFSANHQETIMAVLIQDGKKVKGADYVHFEIWKQDGSVNYGMEEARDEENGTYSLRKSFDSEGLYFIKVHASNKGSIIMPQKQFIVGKLSESDISFLKKGAQIEDGSHENHH